MGNRIIFRQGDDAEHDVKMSNGLTFIFINVLALAGGDLAQTDDQKAWMVWLGEHDQGVFGVGTVGFAIAEMPWRISTFKQEQAFLLQVVEAALMKTHWDRLGYAVREDWVINSLRKFHHLLDRMTAEDIDERHYKEWLSAGEPPLGFPRCLVHHVYLHEYGCVLCNEFREIAAG